MNAVLVIMQSNSSSVGNVKSCQLSVYSLIHREGALVIFVFVTDYFFICFTCRVKAERVHELNEEIGKLLARAEQLGGEGNVDEAQQVLEKVEKTRAMKKEAEVRHFITGLCLILLKQFHSYVSTHTTSIQIL